MKDIGFKGDVGDLVCKLIATDPGRRLAARIFISGINKQLGTPDVKLEDDVADYMLTNPEHFELTGPT